MIKMKQQELKEHLEDLKKDLLILENRINRKQMQIIKIKEEILRGEDLNDYTFQLQQQNN